MGNLVLLRIVILMNSKSLLSLCLALVYLASSAHALSCICEKGERHDWILALRLPGSTPRQMYRFDTTGKKWKQLDESDGGEAYLRKLLSQVHPTTHSYIAFNDESPEGNGSTGGSTTAHAKGVVAWDPKKGEGFYLLHSVPKFPHFSKTKGFDYVTPSSSSYGQHYLCITLKSEEHVTKLREMFAYQNSHVYVDNFDPLEEKVTARRQFMAQKMLKASSDDETVYNELVWGWTMITKPRADTDLLWDDSVVPYYKDAFAVKSWGRPASASHCRSALKISNVSSVGFSSDVTWDDTNDHSKWGVSEKKKIFCIADMNRMDSQATRGGSALCIDNTTVHTGFKDIVAKDECGLIV